MKLCDIVQFYSPLSGGVKRYVSEKSLFFGSIPGIRHIIIVPSTRNKVSEEGHSVIYEVKSPPIPFSQSYRALISRNRIATIMDGEKPDLIEVGDPYRAAWIAIEQSRRMNIPVAAYYHSDYPRAFGRTISKYLGRNCERFVSPRINTYLVNLYNQMDASMVATEGMRSLLADMGIRNLSIIPPGIDTEIFSPAVPRKEIRTVLGIAPECRMLLYVGRLAREKNVVKLLRMHELLSEKNDVHLHIVGDGELRGPVKRHLRRNLNSTWLPYCGDKARLAAIYTAADLLVHPGTEETFGLVSAEAQACGLRVLGVRGGGIDDTLPEPDRGLMARSCGPEDLARAAEEMLAQKTTEEDRRRRRERIVELYSSSATCKSLLELYERIMARRRSAA